MTKQIPSNQLEDGEEDLAPPPPKKLIKRKMTVKDYFQLGGSVNAILLTVIGAGAWAFNQLPFEKVADHNRDVAEIRSQSSQITNDVSQLKGGMAEINRNGQMTLQLTLQQRLDALTEAMKAMSPNSPSYEALREARAELNQQLNQLNDRLRR